MSGDEANCRSLVWERPYFHRSPALEQSIDAAIKASGLTVGEIDHYDFYS
jgi:hypothetical protein